MSLPTKSFAPWLNGRHYKWPEQNLRSRAGCYWNGWYTGGAKERSGYSWSTGGVQYYSFLPAALTIPDSTTANMALKLTRFRLELSSQRCIRETFAGIMWICRTCTVSSSSISVKLQICTGPRPKDRPYPSNTHTRGKYYSPLWIFQFKTDPFWNHLHPGLWQCWNVPILVYLWNSEVLQVKALPPFTSQIRYSPSSNVVT